MARIFKKRSYKKRMRSYAAGKSGVSRFQMSFWPPILKLVGLLAGAVATTLIIVNVVIPWTRGDFISVPLPEPSRYQTPVMSGEASGGGGTGLSELQRDANVGFKSINDPFMCEDEIVFSKAVAKDGVSRYTSLCIYDCLAETTAEVPGVTVKYDNILQPHITADYIVWVDSQMAGGGRICALDRASGKQFTIKEFAFATPILRTNNNMLCFIQQAGEDVDKLYVFDMEKRESVCIETFSSLPTPITSADISGRDVVYAVPSQADGIFKSRVYRYSLETGEKTQLGWDTYTQNPRTDGKYVVFGTSTAGLGYYDVYVEKGKNSPVLIAEDVLNFDMGDGIAVYTKNEAVYVYNIPTGETSRLSSDKTRGLLYSVNKNEVCWYDVTGGYTGIDVCKYAAVKWN